MFLLLEFLGLFAFILVLGYLVPAGQFYFAYYVRPKPQHAELRIQQREPSPAQIRREVRMSFSSIVIFAAMGTGLLQLYKAGMTGIYWRFRDYPLYYLPISFFLCLLAHDTFFYWSHRLMHWRPLFKFAHLGHHRSISPTPWAIYAFQPPEAVIQFVGIMLIVVFVPLHPTMLLAFLWYDTLVNTAGHTGYEVVPRAVARSWLFRGFNTVAHHDAHHTNMRVNFGSFFNVWDRLMGTFLDAKVEPAPLDCGRERALNAPSYSAYSARSPHRLRAASAQRRFPLNGQRDKC